ncbi:MAG: PAS domain S-box protein [Chitinophagales bacterium]
MAESPSKISQFLSGKLNALVSKEEHKLNEKPRVEAEDSPFSRHYDELEVLKSLNLRADDIKRYFNEFFCLPSSVVDDKGRFLFMNPAFAQLFQTEPDILAKTNCLLLYPEEGRAKAIASMELRKKGVADNYAAKLLRADGSDLYVQVISLPLFTEQHQFIGCFTSLRDISREKELEEKLAHSREELEATVQKRTRELTISNYHMVSEIKERKLAEIAVKNSEKRFRDLFYSSPEGVFVEDMQGNILDLNDAGAALHGYTREEMLGRNIRSFSPSEDHPDFEIRQTQLAEGELSSFEAKVLQKNGKLIPVAVRSAVIDFNGKPALLLHARDISDRVLYQESLQRANLDLEEKVTARTAELEQLNQTLQNEISFRLDAEVAIQRQKDFLRLLIDMNPNMIFVKDRDGRFVLVNDAFAKFYGTDPGKMIGKTQADYTSNRELVKIFLDQDREVLATNTTRHYNEKVLYKPTTGEKMFINILKRPIKALNEDENNVLGILTDVTEIKKAEERLRQSELLYRQIARNVPNSGIFIFDKEYRYALAEGDLVGLFSPPKEEIEGKTIYEVRIDEELPADCEKRYEKVIFQGETDIRHYDANGKSYLINTLPIKDAQGNIIYGMVLVLEITDLKKAQVELEEKADKLKRSNEELERFAYVASHDLQAPLRTIASYLQLLDQRYTTQLTGDAKEFINFSVAGAKRMQQLITDLLNYSRLNSVPRPYVPVQLNELLFVVTKNLESTIISREATVEYGTLPEIFAEPYQVTQMLQNLIDNGMKFVKDRKPQITITCTELPEFWQLSVRDNGIGIKPEFKDKVFNIFQRLHAENEYPGTGIGLAICKKVSDLHDGKIWFESEVGVGTTFHITISKNLKNKLREA